jgi:hypothetical protein
VFGERARQTGTLVIVWGHGHAERWVLLTDLAPRLDSPVVLLNLRIACGHLLRIEVVQRHGLR